MLNDAHSSHRHRASGHMAAGCNRLSPSRLARVFASCSTPARHGRRSQPSSGPNSSRLRATMPNTSFKVTRRPVTQFAVANWPPVHRAPQLDR